jgi:uncharacterized protein
LLCSVMRLSFDPGKLSRNIRKHGVSFAAMEEFDWDAALVLANVRFDQPEPRLPALSLIGDRLHFAVFTIERRTVRIISLRKANNREIDRRAGQQRNSARPIRSTSSGNPPLISRRGCPERHI